MEVIEKMGTDPLTGLSTEHIVDMARRSLERPEDFGYWGDADMFNTWGWAGIDYHRDSKILDHANYQTFHRDIVPNYADYFDSERMNHWAVGWVERTIVKVLVNDEDGIIFENITDAFCKTVEMLNVLDEYPVFDDELYCEMEWKKNIEILKDASPPMVSREDPLWAENLLGELLDMNVEMVPDADCYPDIEEIVEAAYHMNLVSKDHEEEWMEFCFDHNMAKPSIFLKQQVDGQIGFKF
jgi:hypothetical protein